MDVLQDFFVLLGRVCISGTFLWGAYEKFKNYNATMSYMKSRNIPKVNIVLPVSLALKVLGGLLIFFGWHAHIGAFLLLIVMVPSVTRLHAFWDRTGNDKEVERALFMKEVAIIGGILLLLALGAGHYGLGGGG